MVECWAILRRQWRISEVTRLIKVICIHPYYRRGCKQIYRQSRIRFLIWHKKYFFLCFVHATKLPSNPLTLDPSKTLDIYLSKVCHHQHVSRKGNEENNARFRKPAGLQTCFNFLDVTQRRYSSVQFSTAIFLISPHTCLLTERADKDWRGKKSGHEEIHKGLRDWGQNQPTHQLIIIIRINNSHQCWSFYFLVARAARPDNSHCDTLSILSSLCFFAPLQ